jgi:hypothetical protein
MASIMCFLGKIPEAAWGNPLDAIGVILSLCALFFAILIPRKIMVNQIFADLLEEYRSAEMGVAIMGLVDFYVFTCNRDISQIEKKYKELFDNEIGPGNKRNEKIPLKDTLHFKRRLLWQYYWQLATLRYEYFWGKLSRKRLRDNFTEKESQVIAVLYYTAHAARLMFDEIGDVQEPEEQDGKGEELMYRFYEESKEW